jgi:hypothetical protein
MLDTGHRAGAVAGTTEKGTLPLPSLKVKLPLIPQYLPQVRGISLWLRDPSEKG